MSAPAPKPAPPLQVAALDVQLDQDNNLIYLRPDGRHLQFHMPTVTWIPIPARRHLALRPAPAKVFHMFKASLLEALERTRS